MINNNMDMIKQLNNIPDYDEYVALCKKNNIPFNDLNRYCVGVGLLSIALHRYSGMDWQEAYTKIIKDVNTQDEATMNESGGCCKVAKKEPQKDEKPLGLLATGKELIKSTAEHVKKGMSHVSPEEHLRRLAICKDCEWVEEGFKCGKCHCFMGVKAGWDIKKACKLNKW